MQGALDSEIFMSLLGLKNGESCFVEKIDEQAECYERFLELGFTHGETITVVRRAPFGGPIQVVVRGTSYAIGREDAKYIQIMK